MKHRFYFFKYPLIFWLITFILIPSSVIFALVFFSFHPTNFFSLPLTLSNFKKLFELHFVQIFLNSLFLAGGATILSLLLGYPFAFILSWLTPKKKKLALFFIILPFWTNSLIRTYSLVLLLGKKGFFNNFLLALGIVNTPLELLYTKIAVFIGLVYTLLPFMILPIYSSFEKMNKKLLEAARDLGASSWNVFFKIILPLTRSGIYSGCLLVFLPALGMFYIPDILGGSRDILLGNFIKDQFLFTRNWPLGAAASLVLSLIMIVLSTLFFKEKKIKFVHE